MKKFTIVLLTVALALSIGGISASAANTGRERSFAGANHNGICDLIENNCVSANSARDSVCGNFDSRVCRADLTDAVCNSACKIADSKDSGVHHNSCGSNCTNYVDADANGTCDNKNNETCPQNAQEYVHGHNGNGHHEGKRCK